MIDLVSMVRPRCIISAWQLFGLVGTDAAIGLIYLTTSAGMGKMLRDGGGSLRVTAGTMKGATLFIFSCGLTHIFKILTLFFVDLDGAYLAVQVWTALVSAWTLKRFIRQLPRLIQALRDAHSLATQIASRG